MRGQSTHRLRLEFTAGTGVGAEERGSQVNNPSVCNLSVVCLNQLTKYKLVIFDLDSPKHDRLIGRALQLRHQCTMRILKVKFFCVPISGEKTIMWKTFSQYGSLMSTRMTCSAACPGQRQPEYQLQISMLKLKHSTDRSSGWYHHDTADAGT